MPLTMAEIGKVSVINRAVKSGENALLIKTRNDNADHIVSRIIFDCHMAAAPF